MWKAVAKRTLQGVALVVAFPMALVSAFGRIEKLFCCLAQLCALAPGIVGDYLRVAYYKLTLESCSLEWRIQFGSFFSHPQVRVGRMVYIGAYCVLGHAVIGDRTQIASMVQILSGRRQHGRDTDGRLLGSGRFERIAIGQDCWIGAGAIVMAEVGDRSTVGAGSVVIKAVPAGSVVAGNPARDVVTTTAS